MTPVAFKALVLEQWCRAFSSLATPRAERLDQVVREGTLKPASQARSPIVMFVYRRPEHTLRTLESLSRDPLAPGSDLHIYCDGPRSGSEDEAVNEVRRVIRRRPWCGRVTIREREENLGLAASVMAGVSEMLERHESIIVLEDDLELSPRFLEYMNSALERYRHEARVMQISGYMFPTAVGEQGEAGFLPMISSWGWGTWRRAWQHFDPTLTSWEMLLGDKELQHRFDLEGSFPFTWLLRELLAGRTDSWAIRWYLSVFRQQGLTLFPARSYVHNFGWDGSGTNCPPSPVYKTEVSLEPVRDFPETIAITPALHAGVKKFLGKYHPQRRPGVVRRMFGRLRQLLRAKG